MRIGTLFSGIGSPEQGASRVYKDLEIVFACEWDKYARESFNTNYDIAPEHFHKDIADMDGTQYKDKVDIIVGGSPCQDFSIAGLRAGVDGNKGVLIYEYIRIIEEVSPPIFIYENVKGMLSDKGGRTIKEFVEAFREMGYYCHYEVLNTKDYGVPQNRERIFLVGFKDHEHYYNFSFAPKQKLTARLKDLLESDVDEKYYLSNKMIDYLDRKPRAIPKGDITTEYSPCIVSVYHKTPTEGFYIKEPQLNQVGTLDIKGNDSIKRVYDTDGISPTLTTMGGGNREPKIYQTSRGYNKGGEKEICPTITTNSWQDNNHLIQDYRIRKLTPRECFRLQDFPDTFKFVDKSYFRNELSVKWYNDLDKRIVVKEELWEELARLMGVKTNMLRKDFVGSIIKDGELTTIPILSLSTQTEKTISANTVIGLLEKVSEECALDTITPGELMAMQQELIISQANKGLIKVSMDIGRTDMQKSKKMESSNIETGLMLKVSSIDLLKKERLYTTLISIKKMTQWITYGCLKDKANITLHIRVLSCADLSFSKEDLSSLKMENISFVSNSQLYKQAGNSISVNVMEMIFNQIERSRHGNTVEGSLF